jgi:hypothetical protein
MGKKNLFNFISCSSLQHSRVCRLTERYYCWNNYKSIYIYIYKYICTLISRTVTVSVYKTNSATHSGPLQQLVTMNFVEPQSPTNRHPLLFFKSLTSFQKPSAVCVVAAFCLHSVESLKYIRGEKKLNIYGI